MKYALCLILIFVFFWIVNLKNYPSTVKESYVRGCIEGYKSETDLIDPEHVLYNEQQSLEKSRLVCHCLFKEAESRKIGLPLIHVPFSDVVLYGGIQTSDFSKIASWQSSCTNLVLEK